MSMNKYSLPNWETLKANISAHKNMFKQFESYVNNTKSVGVKESLNNIKACFTYIDDITENDSLSALDRFEVINMLYHISKAFSDVFSKLKR